MLEILAGLVFAGLAISDRGCKDGVASFYRQRAIERGDEYYIRNDQRIFACDNNVEMLYDTSIGKLVSKKRGQHCMIDPEKKTIIKSVNAAIADGCRYANIYCGARGILLYDVTRVDEDHPYGQLITSKEVCYYPTYKDGEKKRLGDCIWIDMSDEIMTIRNIVMASHDAKDKRNFCANIYFHQFERFIPVVVYEDGSYKLVGAKPDFSKYPSYMCGAKQTMGSFGTNAVKNWFFTYTTE